MELRLTKDEITKILLAEVNKAFNAEFNTVDYNSYLHAATFTVEKDKVAE